MPFVLDNSVVSGWYLDNQATPYTAAVAERLLDDRALAPPLWELELANVLRSACLRGRMTAQHAQEVLVRIAQLPIEVDRGAVPPRELLALALRFGLTSYDAAYLELALRRQLPLATQDGPLRDAALAAGVGVVDGDGPPTKLPP
jgi:predicted nucleic acid-binding protein